MTATLLRPTSDQAPVEYALVNSIADDYDPETLLWIVFHRPDGGARVWYAWTASGEPLGNRIDHDARAGGLDAVDWLAITTRHCTHRTRGRIDIQVHPLRPIQEDVAAGRRASHEDRDKARQLLDAACDMTGQPRRPADQHPRWVGVGPALLARR
ncbi:hypothetical protein [Peterkaempfera griseoplana]|uniref:hypothetical protein n=1 Tax=Peterkaempfera griseoplana TaxID=66896 RepID=UPI0006E1AE3D|nr:hypothetical protein [Peterkaempfera griseoplana]